MVTGGGPFTPGESTDPELEAILSTPIAYTVEGTEDCDTVLPPTPRPEEISETHSPPEAAIPTFSVPPSAPLVHSTGSTTNSMTVQWKQGGNGGAPIRGFVLHYKEDQGEWEEVKISRLESSYVLDKLLCGTSYQMYVTALNSIGMAPPVKQW